MSHIVIDARDSGSGSGRYIDKLVEHMHTIRPSHKITILVQPRRVEFMQQIAPNFTTVICPHQQFTFAEQLAYKKQLEGLKADLVHFGMVQQPILYRGKTVTTMQDLTTVRFKSPNMNPLVLMIKLPVYAWLNKRVARKSNAIITPSEYVKNDVANFAHINPDKITVTLEASDQLPQPAEPIPDLENTKFLMYIGRPMPHKNLRRLIDAFALLKQKHPELKLVLAGKKDALYETHEKYAAEQGIKDIVFTGFVSEQQLRWLYENCAAYTFPSLSEGFGLPALEALAHGTPLVSTNATCSPEIYGNAAHYFDPTNVEDMARAIEDVTTDPILRQDLIEKGKAQAAKYSWRRMAEQTLAVYNQVLGEK